MRFKVAKRDLEAALQVVVASISNSGSDITAHYIFRRTGTEDDKYGIEVMTYSGQTSASCPLAAVAFDDVGTKKNTAFTVEGWRLKDWLKCVEADAVLDICLEDKVVILRVKRGVQEFKSLDPSVFPYWDKTLKEAEVKATVPADRLAQALLFSKMFILDKETTEPDKAVCEVFGGVLYSSDKKSIAMVRVSGLEESGLRVVGKDVSAVISFLNTAGEGNVEILEHVKNIFIRRCLDGAIFAESRFSHQFAEPKIKIDTPSHHTWEVPCNELREAIGFLAAGADPKDPKIGFAAGENPGEVVISMVNATGKTISQTISDVATKSADKAPPVPETGFQVDYTILNRVLGFLKDTPTVRFGLSFPNATTGLIRLRHEKPDLTFVTLLATIY